MRSVKTRLPTPAIRALQTSYDGADGLAGLAVSYLVFVGRAVVSNVDLRRADFGLQWAEGRYWASTPRRSDPKVLRETSTHGERRRTIPSAWLGYSFRVSIYYKRPTYRDYHCHFGHIVNVRDSNSSREVPSVSILTILRRKWLRRTQFDFGARLRGCT